MLQAFHSWENAWSEMLGFLPWNCLALPILCEQSVTQKDNEVYMRAHWKSSGISNSEIKGWEGKLYAERESGKWLLLTFCYICARGPVLQGWVKYLPNLEGVLTLCQKIPHQYIMVPNKKCHNKVGSESMVEKELLKNPLGSSRLLQSVREKLLKLDIISHRVLLFIHWFL